MSEAITLLEEACVKTVDGNSEILTPSQTRRPPNEFWPPKDLLCATRLRHIAFSVFEYVALFWGVYTGANEIQKHLFQWANKFHRISETAVINLPLIQILASFAPSTEENKIVRQCWFWTAGSRCLRERAVNGVWNEVREVKTTTVESKKHDSSCACCYHFCPPPQLVYRTGDRTSICHLLWIAWGETDPIQIVGFRMSRSQTIVCLSRKTVCSVDVRQCSASHA